MNMDWGFKVPVTEVIDYTIQNVCWGRVCRLGSTPDDPFNGAEYQFRHVLQINVVNEHKLAKELLGDREFGPRLVNVMTLPLSSKDTNETAHKEAHDLAWKMLAQTSHQKFSRAAGLLKAPQPGYILDANPGSECLPGTFGELMQYGAVHFRQKRNNISVRDSWMPEKIINKGLLEP